MEVLGTFGFLTSLAESACRFFSGLEILPTAFLSVKFNFEPLESLAWSCWVALRIPATAIRQGPLGWSLPSLERSVRLSAAWLG